MIAGMGELLERINATTIKKIFRLVMPLKKCMIYYSNARNKNSWDK